MVDSPLLFFVKKKTTTLPETNELHLKIGLPNRKVVFQPSIFRGNSLVSGSVNVSKLGALQTFNWFPEQKQTVVPFLFGGLTGVLGGVSKFVGHTRFCMYMYTYTYIHIYM